MDITRLARFTVALIGSQSCGVVVPAREGKANIVYLAINTIFPLHKTHAGYLVCISDLGGEPQRNGSARILYETNTELKRRIYDNTIVVCLYLLRCASPAINKSRF